MSLSMPERWLSRRLQRWTGRRPTHDLLLRANGLWDGTQHWPGFAAWCGAHRGQRCRLWLSQALLHELLCDPALPIADDAAALAWARPLLQHYHGNAALAWPLAAWQQGRQRGVSVLHGVALADLLAAAQPADVALLRVGPWWSLRLQRALQQHKPLHGPRALLLLLEGERLAVLGLAHGQLNRLELRCLDGTAEQTLAPWCGAADVPTLTLDDGDSPAPLRHAASQARWLAPVPAVLA